MDSIGFDTSDILLLQAEQFSTTFFASCKRLKINAQLDPCHDWLRDLYIGNYRNPSSGTTTFAYDTTYYMQWSLKAVENQKVIFSIEVSQPMADAIQDSFQIQTRQVEREVGTYTGQKAKFVIKKDILCNPEDISIRVAGAVKKTMADKQGRLTFSTTAQNANWSLNITPSLLLLQTTTSQSGTTCNTAAPIITMAQPIVAGPTSFQFPPTSCLFNPAVPPPTSQNRFSESDQSADYQNFRKYANNQTGNRFANIQTGNRIASFSKRKIIPDEQSSTSSSSRLTVGEKSKKKTTGNARTSTPRKRRGKEEDNHHYDTISPLELDLSSENELSPEQISLFTKQFQNALNVDPEDPLSKFLTSSLPSVLSHMSKKGSKLNDSKQSENERLHTKNMEELYDVTRKQILASKQTPVAAAPSPPQLESPASTSPQRGAVSASTISQQPPPLTVCFNNSAPIPEILNITNESANNNQEPQQIVTRAQSKSQIK